MVYQDKIPVFFHLQQLDFKPLYEWAFGKKIRHPETTKRAENILKALKEKSDYFEIRTPQKIPIRILRETHSSQLIHLLKTFTNYPAGETFYPSIFPKRSKALADPTNIYHAGFFCFDSGTPLDSQTWSAASWSAACAYEAALFIESGKGRLAYALSRPPGHHASKDLFGGYCYFNNAVISSKVLGKKGRVVILDIDFHHGNGTQEYFYKDDHVFFISLHGDPRKYYPFYSGFSHETGEGLGGGFTLNIPLPKETNFKDYSEILKSVVIPKIRLFNPTYLVISAGFDIYHLDPIGGFSLDTEDIFKIGEILGALELPTLIVQEGGYYTKDLGKNVSAFLQGIKIM